MNKPIRNSELSRRQVMIGAAGLSFAFAIGRADAAVPGTERTGQALSPWVSIAPDGTITILSAGAEMGQGSMTSLALIVAELGVALADLGAGALDERVQQVVGLDAEPLPSRHLHERPLGLPGIRRRREPELARRGM